MIYDAICCPYVQFMKSKDCLKLELDSNSLGNLNMYYPGSHWEYVSLSVKCVVALKAQAHCLTQEPTLLP